MRHAFHLLALVELDTREVLDASLPIAVPRIEREPLRPPRTRLRKWEASASAMRTSALLAARDSLERAPLSFLIAPSAAAEKGVFGLDAFNQVDCPAETKYTAGSLIRS